MAGKSTVAIDDELVQVNVRLRRPRVEVARRVAATRSESLTQYFDRLLAEDMEREREALLRRFDEETRAVQAAKEAALRELAK